MVDWNEIKFTKPIKKWKPNLIQRLLIKLKIIKDKRYNSKKHNWHLMDEVGHFDFDIMPKDGWRVKK